MTALDKKLIKLQPDEVIIYKRRIAGKLVTVHNIGIVHKPFGDKRHWIIHNRKSSGAGTKTEILNKLRMLIV